VPRVELARAAVEDLDRLIETLTLPADTRARIQRSLRPLERFPLIGPELTGPWQGYRFIVGPWRWLVIVYEVSSPERVVVVAVHDVRTSSAAVRHAR
jgi:plasmid stabilization system protein ParE